MNLRRRSRITRAERLSIPPESSARVNSGVALEPSPTGLSFLILIGLLLLLSTSARAQWSTESYPLKSGWNAIWVSQDCSHVSIDTLLAAQPNILEVWRWNPLGSTVQFTSSPAAPITSDVEWVVWRRGDPANSALTAISGNAGYLVRLAVGANLTLDLTGKPLPPSYVWQSTGLNFIGFPMVSPSSSAQQNFERFFSYSAVLKTSPSVFFYNGGPLSSVAPRNPLQAFPLRSTTVGRGTAYWVQGAAYNDYYGPLRVDVSGSGGLDFGQTRSIGSVRLRNVVDPAKNQSVTVTLARVSSAAPPTGQTASAGDVPLLLRGNLDPATGQFSYSSFSGPLSITLPPGGDTEVFIGVNRAALGSTGGQDFQSLLRVTDSLNLTRIDLPVHAVSTSLSGLWIGEATVTKVDQIQGQTSTLVTTGDTTFPIRLLVHMADGGQTTLLQQVYVSHTPGSGSGLGPEIVLTKKAYDALNLSSTTRLSTANFPLDLALVGSGQLGTAGALNFNVILGYNDATNPFVHTYHPDHDNLDAHFNAAILPPDVESHTVSRAITLNFQSSLAGVSDPSFGSTILGGTYSETISGLRAQAIHVSGIFVLRRASSAASLLTQ